MTAMVRAELAKLTRRKTLLGIGGAAAALSILATVLTFNAAKSATDTIGQHRPGALDFSLPLLAHANGWTTGFAAASGFIGIVLLIMGAVTFAGEFSNGTIRNLLVFEPRRVRVIAGKAVALAAFVAGALMVAELFGIATSFVMANVRGVDTTAWLSGTGLLALGSAYGHAVFAAVAWAMIGAAAAVVFRSVPLTLAVVLAWFFPLENILNNTVPASQKWLPGLVLEGIQTGGTAAISLGRGIALATVYVIALAAISAIAFARRDITA
jgi:ABC-type transport system involved in multi-copper enzyme maturation permease subunit